MACRGNIKSCKKGKTGSNVIKKKKKKTGSRRKGGTRRKSNRMDPDVARWSLEFLLRNTATDTTLIKKIISRIPVSDTDSRFKKTLLLRTLQDNLSTASISESMLETLELLEELYRCDGSPINAAMNAAYCAVAVECTLKYLELDPAYLNAVERIWRGRVRYMEASASGDGSLLFSEELKRWRSEIEASLLDSEVMERLGSMNTRRDAIHKLKVFLGEAWANMGPPFLELATCLCLPPEHRLTGNLSCQRTGAASIDTQTTEFDGHQEKVSPMEIQKDSKLLKGKCTATGGAEEVDPSTSIKTVSMLSHEVQKHGKSHECSPLELHMSDIVRSELAMKDMNKEPPIENQNRDADVPDPHACQSINERDAKLNETTSVYRSDVDHPSLMERNSTARVYEWDDSIDGMQGGTSNHASRFNLPSPKKKNFSPLKKYEPANITKRRKQKKWSQLEEETLRTAVNNFGRGNWKLILNSHRDIFEERTEVDLKDKWRNMTRYGGK
ncbi:uncharacterized protein LOC133311384 [Gastrolobium bilobum]|uniref:uncharacterized protein LOC133311384 n=1 Tax=Gastrolobium bilobum TaxID=150636 RepID=UPI002AB01894|nr:uncharacterized protein LOC133311384 [Gastrolobium bilobum]